MLKQQEMAEYVSSRAAGIQLCCDNWWCKHWAGRDRVTVYVDRTCFGALPDQRASIWRMVLKHGLQAYVGPMVVFAASESRMAYGSIGDQYSIYYNGEGHI